MKLFEVDAGIARDILAVLQGEANKKGKTLELPFPIIKNLLKGDDLGISTPEALIQLKNQFDAAGDVIQDILPDGTVIVKTKTASQLKQAPVQRTAGPSVEKMAKSGAKKLGTEI